MVEAKNLMMGDLVNQDGCTKYSKVAGVRGNKVYVCWADGSVHAKDQYYFSNIDLTEDVLRENGWTCYSGELPMSGRRYWYTPQGEFHIVELKKNVFAVGLSMSGVIIRYIDELQRALRVVGLDEVADRFCETKKN